MADKEAMQIGSRLHRKIQGQMGADYRAEVSLKAEIDCTSYVISVEGRADGIFSEDGKSWIDEIKGTGRDVNKLEEAIAVHLAQAKCYAYIYACQQELAHIGVQMTYVHLETEEVRRIRKEFSFPELEEWFAALIEEYKKWASFQVEWKKVRQASIAGVVFPYPYREGQKDLAAAVYRTIAREKKLFIQAPTGVGKTIATVFPAVKAVGEGLGDKIFYLTAKTITRTVAQEAFSLLKAQGLQYKVLTLTAKEKICLCGEPDCNPEKCPYAQGHFDRVNDAVYELLTGWGKPDAGEQAERGKQKPEEPECGPEIPEGMRMPAEHGTEKTEEPACGPEIPEGVRTPAERPEEQEISGLRDSYTRENLIAHAKKWQVCPFEMSLDLSLWVDAVICDYNYVFDPQARLKRFFADGGRGDYIFLIDEAHNLVERGREMYSAALYKEDFLEMKRLLAPVSRKAARALDKCNKYMLEWKRDCEGYSLCSDIAVFALALLNVSTQLETLLEDGDSPLNRYQTQPESVYGAGTHRQQRSARGAQAHRQPEDGSYAQEYLPGMQPEELPQAPETGAELRKKVLEFYFQVRSFLAIYEELDESYEIYTEHEADGRFKLKLFCIDTAGKIGECLDRGRAAVFFSATLLPIRYYMDLLSGTQEDYAIYAHSPFDLKKKKVLVGTDVSSRYTRRGPEEYQKIAAYIHCAVEARAGNYLVFFPSYKMLEDIRAVFEAAYTDVRVIAQNPRMTEEEREEFLACFSENNTQTLAGFCVLGGIFGEGIDLKRKKLIGAVIVGTGLPQICNEREILKQYYDRRSMDGFAHAYQYPGMNKVMQSAGRVIRTDEDTGVILLLDERFCRRQYLDIFPREWADYETCSLRTAPEKLKYFWKSLEGEEKLWTL